MCGQVGGECVVVWVGENDRWQRSVDGWVGSS